mgnify:CR=1 FL=1
MESGALTLIGLAIMVIAIFGFYFIFVFFDIITKNQKFILESIKELQDKINNQ